ncbi:MAG: HAD-IA family hydrolase [Asticcacaulis sp.]
MGDGPPSRDQIAALSQHVAQAAQAGDKAAHDIFARAGQELAAMIAAIHRALGYAPGETVRVSYSGGVFNCGALILDPLRAGLPQACRLETPILPPGIGAALHAAPAGRRTACAPGTGQATNARMKALLFDMDGTIADTEPFHLEALRRTLRQHGADPDMADFHERISGRTSDAVAAGFFPGATPETRRAFVDTKEALFRDLATEITAMPGLAGLLDEAARRGLKTGLVTNAPPENVSFLLGALGLSGRFDTVVLACELARAKPDPLPYLTALERLSVTADEAMAFEDSLPGLRSARQAGLRCVGMATNLPRDALLAADAVCVLSDFTGFSLATAA